MILLGRNFVRGSEGSGIFEEFRNNFKTFVKNVQVPNWNLNYPRTFFDSSISHFLWKKIWQKQKIQTWVLFIIIAFPLEINSIKTSKIKRIEDIFGLQYVAFPLKRDLTKAKNTNMIGINKYRISFGNKFDKNKQDKKNKTHK